MTQSKNGPKNLNRHFSKEDIQMLTHEKMLNITHYQRNANQNHNEVPSHISQNGCYQSLQTIRDTYVKNILLDSVGEGKGGMI